MCNMKDVCRPCFINDTELNELEIVQLRDKDKIHFKSPTKTYQFRYIATLAGMSQVSSCIPQNKETGRLILLPLCENIQTILIETCGKIFGAKDIRFHGDARPTTIADQRKLLVFLVYA